MELLVFLAVFLRHASFALLGRVALFGCAVFYLFDDLSSVLALVYRAWSRRALVVVAVVGVFAALAVIAIGPQLAPVGVFAASGSCSRWREDIFATMDSFIVSRCSGFSVAAGVCHARSNFYVHSGN